VQSYLIRNPSLLTSLVFYVLVQECHLIKTAAFATCCHDVAPLTDDDQKQYCMTKRWTKRLSAKKSVDSQERESNSDL